MRFLEPDQRLDMDQSLAVAGLDSMNAVELLLELEDTFGFIMPDEHLLDETFSTARTLWEAVSTVGGSTET